MTIQKPAQVLCSIALEIGPLHYDERRLAVYTLQPRDIQILRRERSQVANGFPPFLKVVQRAAADTRSYFLPDRAAALS